jgi:hypothetical protein
MTPEAQRTALLKHLGWTSRMVPSDEDVIKQGYDEFRHTWWYNPEGELATPPDLLNDLNAMHEVEETILSDHAQWCAYTVELEILLEDIGPLIHATAAQKSEAYLKAIGKWEEQA